NYCTIRLTIRACQACARALLDGRAVPRVALDTTEPTGQRGEALRVGHRHLGAAASIRPMMMASLFSCLLMAKAQLLRPARGARRTGEGLSRSQLCVASGRQNAEPKADWAVTP